MCSYEFLKYLTVYMKGYQKLKDEECLRQINATGFFASFHIKGRKTNIILTAKHFAEKANKVTFMIRYMQGDRFVTIPIFANVDWIFCNDADIAYCNIDPIEKRFRNITGKGLFATMITEEDIIKQYELKDIDILDPVVTAGYPNGEASTHHKYPIFKKGYIASLPEDNPEDGEGYIDLSAIGGCSGSPVFLDTTPPKFLGILTSGAADSSSESSCVSMYVPGYKVLEFVRGK